MISGLHRLDLDKLRRLGAEGVSRRLAGLADWRSGSEGMMDAALTEILLGDAGGANG